MPTTTREIWWLTALEATLFFSFSFWVLTASNPDSITLFFTATGATLLFHIAPAFLATMRIPSVVAFWLALGYTERILVSILQSGVPLFCVAIILTLAIAYQAWARFFTLAILTFSCTLLLWAVATTWNGHPGQNPYDNTIPVIQGILVSAAPAVVIARQIGQLATTPATIWSTGLLGIWLPLILSVTIINRAKLSIPIQLAALTLLGPSILSAIALRSIAPQWQGYQRLWYIPLAVALFAIAAPSNLWRAGHQLVNAFATPAYQLWALTIAILFTCHYLINSRKRVSPPTARSHPANQTTIN